MVALGAMFDPGLAKSTVRGTLFPRSLAGCIVEIRLDYLVGAQLRVLEIKINKADLGTGCHTKNQPFEK